jgi:hypothetical protein
MAINKIGKGHKGESCIEAIRSSIKSGEIITAYTLFDRIRQLGSWSADTIWQHLIAHLVNLTPARHHYRSFEPFLFLHEDGRYEVYNPEIHPRLIIEEKEEKPERKVREKKSEKQLSLELRRKRKKRMLSVKEETSDYATDDSEQNL